MIPDDLEGLALADAIGALDAGEQADLRSRIAVLPPETRHAVAELYETAALIGAGVEPIAPPPHVREQVIAATRHAGRYTIQADPPEWTRSPLPGIDVRVLAVDRPRGMATLMIRAEPGAVYPAHHHSGPEECFVVRGSVVIDGRVLRAGDFHHADEGSHHGDITTPDGAEVLVVGAIADYLPS